MSQFPALVVVNAIPVNDPRDKAFRWTLLLFLSHLALFIYKVVYELTVNDEKDNTSPILQITFGFFICGIYLPLTLYRIVKKKNKHMLKMFVVLLMIVSLIDFVNGLSQAGTYFELQHLCKDCEDDFVLQNGTCIREFETIDGSQAFEIDEPNCHTLPEMSAVVATYALQVMTAMIGFITACKVTSSHEEPKQFAQVVSPEEISVIQIEGQPVAVRTEHVPEIISV